MNLNRVSGIAGANGLHFLEMRLCSVPMAACWSAFSIVERNEIKLNELHKKSHFVAHCDVLLVLLKIDRTELNISALKHHIRSAIREASQHVTKLPNRKVQYISVKALNLQSQAKSKHELKGLIIYEHVIPISVLNDHIFNMENPTCDSIQEFLLEFSVTAYIASCENIRLKENKLNEKMPKGTTIFSNKFARYDMVGIPYTAYPAQP
jgi:hypothetical protein